MAVDENKIPVLVACGQVTEHDRSGKGKSPVELMVDACLQAQQDSACSGLLNSVDHMAATGLTVDAPQVKTPLSRAYKNLPKSVANRLNITPKDFYYVATGGNTPQYLVNYFANQISQGQAQSVLLTGGEALATMFGKFDSWYKWLLPKGDWKENPGGLPTMLGDSRACGTKQEELHGLDLPANVYPLFENALRHNYGHTPEQHQAHIGKLFANLTEVAANNPYAWFKHQRTAEALVTPTPDNRYIAYPYTKLLNSMINVNQAAAVVMTSVAKARELGVPEDRWVYLHGCADANDIWNVTERQNFHSSPAMRECANQALSMADKRIEEMQHFDIYSCFPSAVQVACDEFGIAHDDMRGLSLTGGLPYFGGPGNNYSMHAIVEMMQRLRANPADYGLLNANGWFLTKHSVGVYSCQPMTKQWHRVEPSTYQAAILEAERPNVCAEPNGSAEIETYTVLYDRDAQPSRGIVIGRLENGDRFVANTPRDQAMMQELVAADSIGRSGRVNSNNGLNQFSLT